MANNGKIKKKIYSSDLEEAIAFWKWKMHHPNLKVMRYEEINDELLIYSTWRSNTSIRIMED